MSEQDERAQQLIAALSADDADAALVAWATLSHGWKDWPATVQQSAIVAALSSRQPWTASAARRFLTDRWNELTEHAQAAALDTLGTLLDDSEEGDASRASTIWMFLTDHFQRMPATFATLLTADRFATVLARGDVAADAWDFLTAHWERLPERLKTLVSPNAVVAALESPHWRVAVAGWDFLGEHWPRLEERLHDTISADRIAAAVLDPIARLAVEEFVTEHAAVLPPALCQAARPTPGSQHHL
ncbi:MAG: hypothetical protein ACE5E5_03560 [Phycisphaerae bacterium]